MATLAEIAQAAGVSSSTVYRVLNKPANGGVNDALATKIREIAAQMSYETKPRQRKVGASKVRKLAVIGMDGATRDNNIPFFHELTTGIQQHCAARGLSMHNLQFVWSSAIQSYSQFNDCDKIIVLASNLDAADYFRDRDQDVLFVAACPDPQRFPSVCVDLAGGTVQAITHLLALGYDQIGFFGETSERNDPFSRYSTYEALLLRRKIYDERYVDLSGDWTADSGFAMAANAVANHSVARSYFIANDPMAIGAISAFQAHGLRIPEDVAIVGFDNIHLSTFTQPPLTTIDDSSARCAQLAVDLAVDGLGGRIPLMQILVPTTLVIRQSSGAEWLRREAVPTPIG